MSETNGNGSWFSPKTVLQLGVTASGFIFLLLVITGIIPTPLMSALRTIDDVEAGQEGMVPILSEILRLEVLRCVRESETREEQAQCYPSEPITHTDARQTAVVH